MSLEQALKDNTEALKANTALMEKLAKGGAAGGGGGGTRTRKKKATMEDFKKAVGEYTALADSPDDRKLLKAPLVACQKHYGIAKFTDLPEDKIAEMMDKVATLTAAFAGGGVDAALAVDIGVETDDGGEDLM